MLQSTACATIDHPFFNKSTLRKSVLLLTPCTQFTCSLHSSICSSKHHLSPQFLLALHHCIPFGSRVSTKLDSQDRVVFSYFPWLSSQYARIVRRWGKLDPIAACGRNQLFHVHFPHPLGPRDGLDQLRNTSSEGTGSEFYT